MEITFPSGRTAEEICPTEIAVPVWCAHMGTLTFHPWPVRRDDDLLTVASAQRDDKWVYPPAFGPCGAELF